MPPHETGADFLLNSSISHGSVVTVLFFLIVVFCLFNKILLVTVTIYLGWRWPNLGQGEKRRIFLLLYRCSPTALVGKKISYDGSDQVSEAETIWVVLQERENSLMGGCVWGGVEKCNV